MEFKNIQDMTCEEIRQEISEIEKAISLVGRWCVKDEALARLDELRAKSEH